VTSAERYAEEVARSNRELDALGAFHWRPIGEREAAAALVAEKDAEIEMLKADFDTLHEALLTRQGKRGHRPICDCVICLALRKIDARHLAASSTPSLAAQIASARAEVCEKANKVMQSRAPVDDLEDAMDAALDRLKKLENEK